jgi:hypothetical protein
MWPVIQHEIEFDISTQNFFGKYFVGIRVN